MSEYNKTVDFASKDGLSSGDPAKTIYGTEINTEFANIEAALDTKYDDSNIATLSEAQAEASDTVLMTPLKTANWADANAGIVGDLQALADPNADRIPLWDDSAGATVLAAAATGVQITATPTITLDINGLTADATPSGSADYVATYDASASTHKKVLLNNLTGTLAQQVAMLDSDSGYPVPPSTAMFSYGPASPILAASTRYRFTACFIVDNIGGTASKIKLGFTDNGATVSQCEWWVVGESPTNTAAATRVTSYKSALTSVHTTASTTPTTYIVEITGYVVTGGSSTIINAQIGADTANGQVYFREGSWLKFDVTTA